MLKKLILVVLLLASCIQPNRLDLTAAEQEFVKKSIISVGVETNFPPYSYLLETGELVGLSIDVLNTVANRGGLKLNLVRFMDRTEMHQAFADKKLDALAAVNPTPQQLVTVGLTEPYALLSTVMLLNSLPINFPMRVGYSPTYFGQDRLYNLKKQVTVVPLDTDHLVFRALMSGVVDGAVTNLGAAYHFEGVYHRHFKMAPIDFPYALSFGYQLDNELLGSVLQKGVSSLTPLERRELKLEYESPTE